MPKTALFRGAGAWGGPSTFRQRTGVNGHGWARTTAPKTSRLGTTNQEMASPLCSAALRGVSPLLTGQDITTCSHSWPYSASPGEQLQALSGSCGSQSVPQLPAPTTIWDCAGLHQCVLAETPSGTAMGRAHEADGSQGASSTSLSWTHCRDISGTRDCPSTQTAALC